MMGRNPDATYQVTRKLFHWFQRFLKEIYGLGSQLGHMTSIMLINFHFLVHLKAYIPFFVKMAKLFSYVNDHRPWSRNDPALQYSHTFINSVYQLSGHKLQ